MRMESDRSVLPLAYFSEASGDDSKDLQLAAELGKALLERNRELETTVLQLQSTNQEQSMEVQCLLNKIETMKTMNESRMRVYEELDKNALELEKVNQKLTMEAKTDKQKIERLQGTVDGLEARVEELQNKVEELKKKEANANCQQRQNARRANSLASLTDSGDNKGFYLDNLQWTYKEQFKKLPLNPYEVEIRQLQEKNDQFKTQVGIYKRKADDLTGELSILVAENADLDEKVKVLEDKIDIYHCMEYQLRQAAQSSTGPSVCAECGKGVSFSQESQDLILNEVEHDAPVLLSQAKAVKLGGGGSMYSSTESINAVATDAKEISDEGGAAADPGRSILGELESQYKRLLDKYEAMVAGKGSGSKRNSLNLDDVEDSEEREERAQRRRQAHKEVQTLINLTLNRDFTQDTGQPPPYKALFKDLFATLRKTRIDEDSERLSPSTTPEASASSRSLLDKTT